MSRGGVLIRRALRAEWPVCATLYERVLRETFTWMAPERHKATDFLAAAPSEEIYVAERSGVIVGLAAFYRPQNFIHSLYVTDRGQGIGQALLAHLESIADGPLSLKVQTPNVRAQAFYAREGFKSRAWGRDGDISWIRMVREASGRAG